MTPKETLLKVLHHEKTDQIPWVPFAGVHAGRLLGYTATEVLQDEDKLFDSLMEVNKLYRPSGQPVIFDLQVEAECLGCELTWAKDAPPSVSKHPLEEDEELETPCYCTIPTKESGRIPMILRVMKRMKEAVGDTTALYGLICGPFTLATHLRGNNIFMDMYDDEEAVEEFLAYCCAISKKMAEYYIEAGMDVIAVVDPLISQISSNHFEQFMHKPFSELFAHIRELGALSSFFVCGDATRNIEVMCKTCPDAISIDENVDLLDSMEDKTNFILAPGCDMPYAVPVENTIGVAQALYETDSVREMLKNYVAEDDDIEVELPDYEHLEKPLVEVFTLDSATCAACTYMMGAANEAKATFGDAIDMVEYKFTEKENIARCKKMGVPNLPSLYINGKLKFRSLVPAKEELEAAIREVM